MFTCRAGAGLDRERLSSCRNAGKSCWLLALWKPVRVDHPQSSLAMRTTTAPSQRYVLPPTCEGLRILGQAQLVQLQIPKPMPERGVDKSLQNKIKVGVSVQ
jgi:hypothetical protein